jgi:signal transduction histidine kinase
MYTIIEGFRDDARSKGEEDEPYERILSSIDRIKGIIGNMLTFANPSSNAPRMTQLNDLIIQSVEFFKYQPVYRRIRIIMDLADDLPETVLDPNLLIQVIHNMFINSAQAMPDKGEVHINTNYNSNWIIFEFADTGIGISPENLPKIFDPFFTTKPPGMGTGLGLSVSYGIIHDHGGSIEVESEEGKGTKFTIKLPVKKGAGVFDEG